MNGIKVLLVLGITALILVQASELMNEDNVISLSSNVPVSSSLERVLGRADIQGRNNINVITLMIEHLRQENIRGFGFTHGTIDGVSSRGLAGRLVGDTFMYRLMREVVRNRFGNITGLDAVRILGEDGSDLDGTVAMLLLGASQLNNLEESEAFRILNDARQHLGIDQSRVSVIMNINRADSTNEVSVNNASGLSNNCNTNQPDVSNISNEPLSSPNEPFQSATENMSSVINEPTHNQSRYDFFIIFAGFASLSVFVLVAVIATYWRLFSKPERSNQRFNKA